MAYLRYGRDSDWYVFWYSDKAQAQLEATTGKRIPKDDNRLAVWHSAHRATGPIFTYDQVRAMLDAGDFTQVPGFDAADHDTLRGALIEFVEDVDAEYDAR